MRETLRRLRRICSPLTHEPETPVPPPDLPVGRVVHVPGRGEMFLREQEGPQGALPVLLLHGWTASADTTWFSVYPVLAPDHGVLALDHRGHGRGLRAESPFSLEECADDAAALLDLLGIRRAIVGGYSMGGAVAMLIWKRRPDLVAGLVLSGTALEWRSSPRERILWGSVTLLDMILRVGGGDGFVQRYLREAMADVPEVGDLRAWVGGELKRGYPRDVVAAGWALSRFDARPFIGSIDVPCATVVTTYDRLVGPDKQRQLSMLLGARQFEIGGDHDAPLVKAKEFAAAVAEAVTAVARAAATTPASRPRSR
ncbi:MAG: alpha/beta fold hydrolase [Actinomycetota bacterium]|nr:alpha/beta fold hydrolase [Actinomycetota bacterium]MDQ3573516.1 alpha/beta fold hydrolase [Actinomycetota bacterium]